MNWEIIDDNGCIHSGTEDEMRKGFFVMTNLFETIQEEYDLDEDETKDLVDQYPGSWEGDLKLVQIHLIEK